MTGISPSISNDHLENLNCKFPKQQKEISMDSTVFSPFYRFKHLRDFQPKEMLQGVLDGVIMFSKGKSLHKVYQ